MIYHGAMANNAGRTTYMKYKCQYRTNLLLNHLRDDSGYPQRMFEESPRGETVNHVEENKRNLKNFFKDRIPEDRQLRATPKAASGLIRSEKLYEIKCTQDDLKNQTKMSLKNSFKMDPAKRQSIGKISEIFYAKGPAEDLKRKLKTNDQRSYSFYDDLNHQRGTISHIYKRAKVGKKYAYDRVFGPDISSLSRTAYFKFHSSHSTDYKKYSKLVYHRRNNKSNIQKSKHKYLSLLLHRMNGYKNQLEERSYIYVPPVTETYNLYSEYHMVTLIKNIAKMYQGQSINGNRKTLSNLEDLKAFDINFYQEVEKHKARRLRQRMNFVSHTQALIMDSPKERVYEETYRASYSAPSEGDYQEVVVYQKRERYGRRLTAREKFLFLKETLVRWASLYELYGINPKYRFEAFKIAAYPFKLEGSYAFFKTIKFGDINSVKSFLYRNPLYLFEVNYSEKSTLSYACAHNQTEVAYYFLSLGLNTDQKCNKNHTALYYSLMNNNIALVRIILQHCGSPWSTAYNYYGRLLSYRNNQDLLNLFNNARKISTRMHMLTSIRSKNQFWREHRHRIVENIRLTYEDF